MKYYNIIIELEITSKWITVLLICVVCVLQGMGNQINDKKDDVFEDQLKKQFGCNPPENWNLLKQSAKGVVCLPQRYQTNEPPEIGKPTSVSVIFVDTDILKVDERDKSLTLSIKMWLVWEDQRIKVNVSDIDTNIQLPPITLTEHVIWYPLTSAVISNMKEIKPLYDPIIAQQVRLGSDVLANRLLAKGLLSSNSTAVAVNPNWIVKISCDFNFDTYPFDNQTCSFKMIVENINVTLHERPSFFERISKEQDEFDGYKLQRELVLDPLTLSPLFQAPTSEFGVTFKMTRQIEPYIYKYYIPCTAIVVTSFFSFMIPLTAIPGRVAVVVTPLLTVTNIFVHHMVRM